MPPLEMAPGCFVAVTGSSENDELTARAHEGEFEIWDVRDLDSSDKGASYQLFAPDNESIQFAGPAIALEYDMAALLTRAYPVDESEPPQPEKPDPTPKDSINLVAGIVNYIKKMRKGD